MGHRHSRHSGGSPPPPPPIKPIQPSQCSYNMSPIESSCYKNNYPDLSALNTQQLQQHWSSTGCNQKRNNQCPSVQNISGNYTYKGCFNNNSLKNLRGNVQSVDQCEQFAEKNSEMVFGLFDNGNCYTGSNIIDVQQNGQVFNNSLCSKLGGTTTSQIYVRGQPFPPPVIPTPQLSQQNFS